MMEANAARSLVYLILISFNSLRDVIEIDDTYYILS